MLVPVLMLATEHTSLGSLYGFAVGKYLGPQTWTIFLMIARGNPSSRKELRRERWLEPALLSITVLHLHF